MAFGAKIFLSIISLVFLIFISVNLADAAGWLNPWLYKRAIDLAPATSMADYPLQVQLTPANFDYTRLSFPATGADLRFTDIDGTTVLDYWIETWVNGGTSIIWVKVPVSGTSRIYLYYGNASAVPTSNSDAVIVASDFTTFTKVDANNRLSVTASRATFTNLYRNENIYLYKQISPITDYRYDFEYTITGGSSIANNDGFVLIGGLADSASALNNIANALFIKNYNAFHIPTYRMYTDSRLSSTESIISTFVANAGFPYLYITITRVGTTVTTNMYSDAARTIHISGSPQVGSVSSAVAFNYVLPVTALFDGNVIGYVSGYIQNIRIRKYASPEPAVTVGAEILPPPTCTSFSASPAAIDIDGSSTLNWVIADTTSATINPGAIAAAVPSGSASVSPAAPTTYSMDLTGPGGTVLNACTASVSFNPPVCTLVPSATKVLKGETVTLTWTSANALTGAINGINALPVPAVPIGGGSMVSPPINANTSFSMNVSGPGGTVSNACPVIVGFNAPPTNGLIPCGRIADNLATSDIVESNPCTLCAMFYLLKNIINFVMTLAIGIGVFILVIAGLLYALSAGNPRNIELAKSAVTSAIIGIAIVFVAWLAIAVILQGMGYANMSTWNQVNCNV